MVMDYKEFVSKQKAMLVAPAGHGKTHAIAECLNYTTGRQLILTHTHAGVASLKEKIKKLGLSEQKIHVGTISGFAQKYAHAFTIQADFPSQFQSKEYYQLIEEKTIALLALTPVKRVIAASYNGVFVDEYQDCTESQHTLVLALADILPTRIFGDHLQGIFGFGNNVLVDMTDTPKMKGFGEHKYELTEPRRWENHNKELGQALKLMRSNLDSRQPINLADHSCLEVLIAKPDDLFNFEKEYSKKIWSVRGERNLLLIHPDGFSIGPRMKVISAFKNSFSLVEAIDDKDFYKIATRFDDCNAENLEQTIRDVCFEVFNSTKLNIWFNKRGLKRKTKPEEIAIIDPVKIQLNATKQQFSFMGIIEIIQKIKQLPGILCYRGELLHALIKSLQEAQLNFVSVNTSMIERRNQTRRLGRKVDGRSIGTTLLTKGLEFDTVVILDAHEFKCRKHLYVALTRAKKRLIVISETSILSPDS